jgi:3-oxoacyl-[acyl-carrier-protein] synthase II
MAEMGPRVVITGLGAVTSLGVGVDALWDAVAAGRSGIRALTRFDATAYTSRIGAQVDDFDPTPWLDKREVRRMDRFVQFAAVSALMAIRDAGLDLAATDLDRVGVVMGTGIGGMETLTEEFATLTNRGPGRVSPLFIPKMIANMAAGQVAILTGARGPNTTLVTACASSAHAVGEALRLIQRGDADVMITGGSEAAFIPLTFAGFCAMRALSTHNDDPAGASRPFDRERDGFVLGEGGGALVIESEAHARRRGARIRAELCGYGMTADAFHVTQPSPGGEGAARAMRKALEDAALAPEEVDYINAHATATPAGDKEEVAAIHTVFGERASRIPVSATKSMTGHLLGAAGAVEAIICVRCIEEGVVPPTTNYQNPDPECEVDCVPNRARPMPVSVAMSNSFGFGGQNACLIIRRARE